MQIPKTWTVAQVLKSRQDANGEIMLPQGIADELIRLAEIQQQQFELSENTLKELRAQIRSLSGGQSGTSAP